MKRFAFSILILIIPVTVFCQGYKECRILDAKTQLPVEGAFVSLKPSGWMVTSDVKGSFSVPEKFVNDTLHIIAVGYSAYLLPVKAIPIQRIIFLNPVDAVLEHVTVKARSGEEYSIISKADIKMRSINNSQEMLRMVPGIFIGQHQGGGKAEQIFVRGFDCDHGTDINITADGLPVNMVSHGHGQGYADMHFIIPETVENVDFQKGPYHAAKGNFTTSGFVDIKTRNGLSNQLLKIEGGMFNTFRGVGMFNLMNAKARTKQQSLYLATEMAYSDGFFDFPQHFNRLNFFLKYAGKIASHTYLVAAASTFTSKWDATGQIPERSVKDGSIGFFGAIDSSEEGSTSRTNLNLQFVTGLNNGATLKNQLYFSNYNFDLISNFTFFLNDPVNGDQIRQRDYRNVFGYQGSYHAIKQNGKWQITSDYGAGFRSDYIKDLELSNTKSKTLILNRLAYGNIAETNLFAYVSKNIRFNEKLSMYAAIRSDYFFNRYTDHLQQEKKLSARSGIISPKFSLQYQANKKVQLYLNLGKGFHSNDTRVSVVENGRGVLPAAYATDLGVMIKPTKSLFVQAALWYLYLDQEFVYSGDGAYVEPSGKTRRTGIDVSLRYEPLRYVYLDADLNYAFGRFTEAAKGENYIPLAPVWSSTGGITVKKQQGLNGSLRYRWLGNRPATEDYSLTAYGYFITDLVLNYTTSRFEVGLTLNNIFNTQWKETQFSTESQLKNEAVPVQEIHFTAGTPFSARLGLSVFF